MNEREWDGVKEKLSQPVVRDSVTTVLIVVVTTILSTALLFIVERTIRNTVTNRQQEEHIEAIDNRIMQLEYKIEWLEAMEEGRANAERQLLVKPPK